MCARFVLAPTRNGGRVYAKSLDRREKPLSSLRQVSMSQPPRRVFFASSAILRSWHRRFHRKAGRIAQAKCHHGADQDPPSPGHGGEPPPIDFPHPSRERSNRFPLAI